MKKLFNLLFVIILFFSCLQKKEPNAWLVPDKKIEVNTKKNDNKIILDQFHIYDLYSGKNDSYYLIVNNKKYIVNDKINKIFNDVEKAKKYSSQNLEKIEKKEINTQLKEIVIKDINNYKEDIINSIKFINYNDDYGISFQYPELWTTPISANSKENFNDLISNIRDRGIAWDKNGLKIYLDFFHLEDLAKLEKNINQFNKIKEITASKQVISSKDVYGPNIDLINDNFHLLTNYKTFQNQNFYGFNTINIGFIMQKPKPSYIQYSEYGYSKISNLGYHFTFIIKCKLTEQLSEIENNFDYKILGNELDKYIQQLINTNSDFVNQIQIIQYVINSLEWNFERFQNKMNYQFKNSYLNNNEMKKAENQYNQKKYDEALFWYQKALEISPYDKIAFKNVGIMNYNIGIGYYNNQDYDQAKSYFIEATKYGKEIKQELLDNVGIK